MKRNRILLCLALSSLVVGLSSCNNTVSNGHVEENKGTLEEYNVSYYDNYLYSDYATNGASSISNQWSNYGMSSPFIMRFNGEYYLYASTSSNTNENGIRGWKSQDLINWDVMTGEGLTTGYVVGKDQGISFKARAPEVYYYDGHFYMYESYNNGAGHFVLKSDSPSGPFVPLSKAPLDSKRDGTVVFGKNENPYFITGGKGQISISTMQSMESILDTGIKVNGTDKYFGLNTDSPAVFDHCGKYYLLYSSGYDKINSYHINYAVSDSWEDETPSGLAASFRSGATDKLLVNTKSNSGFTGLGHPSVALGPDLDSYYMAYDSLDDGKNNIHSFNLDRLFANGDLLTVEHNKYNSIKPTSAAFSTADENGFNNDVTNYLLTQEETDDAFSIEYNFINAKNSELVFSYKDSSNYSYLKVDVSSALSLWQKEDGKDKLITSVDFYNFFKNEDLHCVRLSYRDDKLDIHFDESLKLSQYKAHFDNGKIGYMKGDGLEVCHTSYSNVAFGLSNQKEIKQSNLNIPTSLHMISEQVDELDSYQYSDSSLINGVGDYNNVPHLSLKHNEYARYLVNFKKTATYTAEFLINKKSNGKSLIVEIDDGQNVTLNLPYSYANGEYIKVIAGEFEISKGVHQFKIQGLNNEFDCVSFRFIEKTQPNVYTHATLENEGNIRGLLFGSDSTWSFDSGSMTSLSNHRNIALSVDENISDFDLSVDMALTGDDSIFRESDESGVTFRCSQFANYRDYLNDASDLAMWNGRKFDIRGYYLSFTPRKVSLYKMDLNERSMVVIDSIQFAFGSKHFKNIILKVRNNRFDLFIDNTFVKTYYDSLAYTTGAVGLYATGAESAYKEFKLITK